MKVQKKTTIVTSAPAPTPAKKKGAKKEDPKEAPIEQIKILCGVKVGEKLVLSWYDSGMRHCAAEVTAAVAGIREVREEEPVVDRIASQAVISLKTFRPNSPVSTIHLRSETGRHWVGPGGLRYEMEQPANERTANSIEQMRQSAETFKTRDLTPAATHRKEKVRKERLPSAPKFRSSKEQPFRPGSGKSTVYQWMGDGKPRTLEQIKEYCVQLGKAPALGHHILNDLRRLNLVTEAKGKVQIARAK